MEVYYNNNIGTVISNPMYHRKYSNGDNLYIIKHVKSKILTLYNIVYKNSYNIECFYLYNGLVVDHYFIKFKNAFIKTYPDMIELILERDERNYVSSNINDKIDYTYSSVMLMYSDYFNRLFEYNKGRIFTYLDIIQEFQKKRDKIKDSLYYRKLMYWELLTFEYSRINKFIDYPPKKVIRIVNDN